MVFFQWVMVVVVVVVMLVGGGEPAENQRRTTHPLDWTAEEPSLVLRIHVGIFPHFLALAPPAATTPLPSSFSHLCHVVCSCGASHGDGGPLGRLGPFKTDRRDRIPPRLVFNRESSDAVAWLVHAAGWFVFLHGSTGVVARALCRGLVLVFRSI